jgi:hypothetical protein
MVSPRYFAIRLTPLTQFFIHAHASTALLDSYERFI